MSKNFVSVSAVTDSYQLSKIAKIYREERFDFPLVIGYQTSNNNINRGTKNNRQPLFSDIGELDRETRDLRLITAIHYYTKDNSTIVKDLEKVIDTGVDSSRALVQFNTLPPTVEILKQVKNMGFDIIFNVAVSNKKDGGYAVWKGDNTQDVSTGDVTLLVQQVYERKECIDYVMFDPSHGTNLDLDLNKNNLAIRFGKEIEKMGKSLVYAGGISPSNVQKITKTLFTFFPNGVSIDTESGVRVDDFLYFNLVRGYLLNYLEAIES